MENLAIFKNEDLFPNLFFGNFFDDFNTSNSVVNTGIDYLENGISVDVYCPGMEKGDLNVDAFDNKLTIRGNKNEKNKRSYKFEKVYTVPRGYDLNSIKAEYSNGVLNVFVPIDKKLKKKKIEIEIT